MLKRVELSGFKSFAAKTTLEFSKGITAIVGPNGSGKSNIIDAVRWLLGERDAKNLRGAKIEDLIFAGTPSRPRVGLAQAGISFDNTAGLYPVEFSEISILRQVSRDGDSKYYLNKSEVRLKDLVDFFAKARLGAKGLTIIGQGSSDLFIKSTPEERREMIEEILGLREYQLKKGDAERRLKNSLINLDKVTALLEEIAPHLRTLRRQTAKWSRRSEIEEELRDLEAAYFGAKLKEIKDNFAKVDPHIDALLRKIVLAKKELAELAKKVDSVEEEEPSNRDELRALKEGQSALFAKKSALEKELGRLEGQLEILTARGEEEKIDVSAASALIKKLKTELEKFLRMDLDGVRAVVKDLMKEIDGVFKVKKSDGFNVEEAEKSKAKIVASLAELDRELGDSRNKESELNSGMEARNQLFRKTITDFEKKKDEVSALTNEKSRLAFDKERWQIKLNDLKSQASQSGLNLNGLKVREILATAEMADAERKVLRLRGELASMGDIDEALIKEARETETRHEFLSSQSGDLKKAIDDLAKLKKDLAFKIDMEFKSALTDINREFSKFFELMFDGGRAKLKIVQPRNKEQGTRNKEGVVEAEGEERGTSKKEKGAGDKERGDLADEEKEEKPVGIDIEVSIPRKKITGLEMLSGGERSLVSIAALFALVSVSPPPFLVLDEIDAALDKRNARRFAEILKDFSQKTQFVIVTHNRATMEVADVLYGVTMGEDGTSRVLSLKL